jgi:hypothetical protein
MTPGPAVAIRPGTLIVSSGNCVAIGTADEVERFAAELIKAVWDARHPASAAASSRNEIAPQAQREAAD